MRHSVALGLGSNLGNKHQNLISAILGIDRNIGDVVSVSQFYVTKPLNPPDEPNLKQPHFLNAAVLVNTNLEPNELMQSIMELELNLGRIRDQVKRWYPRVIDIDVLLYESIVINEPHISIPHPELHKRMFVLKPLAEIASQVIHPVFKRSIGELCRDLGRPSYDEGL